MEHKPPMKVAFLISARFTPPNQDRRYAVNREEMIAAIKDSTEKLGHVPSTPEFLKFAKISIRMVRKHFGTYTRALEACGLERQGAGYQISMKSLFMEWAGLVRKLGKIPLLAEYEAHSRYSVRPLITRCGNWKSVPQALQQFMKREGLEGEWQDVLNVIERHQDELTDRRRRFKRITETPLRTGLLTGRPIYGTPLLASPMTCAPTNEAGVLFLFGAWGRQLGFVVNFFSKEFPDCEALREIEPGRWQRIRVELEFESRNFIAHGHRPEDCDLIVCWVHNWENCPVEVIELKSIIGGL
jgi:hypothetical protein